MDLRPLLSLPNIDAARSSIRSSDADTLEEQLRIVAIPAPSLEEGLRARYVRGRFVDAGLAEVREDEVGNVIGVHPGSQGDAPVVVAAHLDTVFPPGTDLTPRTVGRRIFAPGIADNARGIAAMLAIARALKTSSVRTRRSVVFVGTVGEEGIGDLRGVKHLFRDAPGENESGPFIALDGCGTRRVVHRAVGARRLRATVRGPGGHSWADWGVANPVNAIGAAIARLRTSPMPRSGRATLTVARIGGGTSVNVIPADAWLEIDLRSEEAGALKALEAEVRRVLRNAVVQESESRRMSTGALTLKIERIGERPAGSVAADDPLVSAALAATRAVGASPELAASSTDANVPLSLGIPAITIGAGGDSGGIHTLDEWYADDDGARGLERALLTVLAATEIRAGGPW